MTTQPVQAETAALLPPRPSFSQARRWFFEAATVPFGGCGYHGVSVRDTDET